MTIQPGEKKNPFNKKRSQRNKALVISVAACIFFGVVGYEIVRQKEPAVYPAKTFLFPQERILSDHLVVELNRKDRNINELKKLLFLQEHAPETAKVAEAQQKIAQKERELEEILAALKSEREKILAAELTLSSLSDLTDFQQNQANSLVLALHRRLFEQEELIRELDRQKQTIQEFFVLKEQSLATAEQAWKEYAIDLNNELQASKQQTSQLIAKADALEKKLEAAQRLKKRMAKLKSAHAALADALEIEKVLYAYRNELERDSYNGEIELLHEKLQEVREDLDNVYGKLLEEEQEKEKILQEMDGHALQNEQLQNALTVARRQAKHRRIYYENAVQDAGLKAAELSDNAAIYSVQQAFIADAAGKQHSRTLNDLRNELERKFSQEEILDARIQQLEDDLKIYEIAKSESPQKEQDFFQEIAALQNQVNEYADQVEKLQQALIEQTNSYKTQLDAQNERAENQVKEYAAQAERLEQALIEQANHHKIHIDDQSERAESLAKEDELKLEIENLKHSYLLASQELSALNQEKEILQELLKETQVFLEDEKTLRLQSELALQTELANLESVYKDTVTVDNHQTNRLQKQLKEIEVKSEELQAALEQERVQYRVELRQAEQNADEFKSLMAQERAHYDDELKEVTQISDKLKAQIATERERYENQLQEANQKREEFSALILEGRSKIEEQKNLLAEAQGHFEETLLESEQKAGQLQTQLAFERSKLEERLKREEEKREELEMLWAAERAHIDEQKTQYEQRGKSLQDALNEAKQRSLRKIAELKRQHEELLQKLEESHTIQASLEEDLFLEKAAALVQATGLYQELNALKKEKAALSERYENELKELKEQIREQVLSLSIENEKN